MPGFRTGFGKQTGVPVPAILHFTSCTLHFAFPAPLRSVKGALGETAKQRDVMTPTEERAFLEQGFATIDTPLTATEIGAASDAFDRLAPFQPPAAGEKPRYRVALGGTFEPALLDLIQHPFFEEVTKQALETEEVRFFQTALTVSYPQPDTPFSFDQHVDIQYCASDFRARPRRIICSYFLWLTDVNERRAPLMFRPRSHLLLAEANERRGAGDDEVRTVRPARMELLPALPYADPMPLLARAGQVSVLTTSAVHGASVNVGDTARKVMVITFIAAGVRIGLPENQAEAKRTYDASLRELLRPERRHIIEA